MLFNTPETIKGSLADTPLGQNNPIDRALGGGLFTLPHLKTNVGYSYYFGRMEEEHE
jgi:hypothetical protein